MIQRILLIGLLAGAVVSGAQGMWGGWGQRRGPFLDPTQQHAKGVLEADLATVILNKVQNLDDAADGEFALFMQDLKAHLQKKWTIDTQVKAIQTPSFGNVSINTAINYIDYILNTLPSDKKKARGRAAFTAVKEALDAQKIEKERLEAEARRKQQEEEAKRRAALRGTFLDPRGVHAHGELEKNLINVVYWRIKDLRNYDDRAFDAFMVELSAQLVHAGLNADITPLNIEGREDLWIIDTKHQCAIDGVGYYQRSVEDFCETPERSWEYCGLASIYDDYNESWKKKCANKACALIWDLCERQAAAVAVIEASRKNAQELERTAKKLEEAREKDRKEEEAEAKRLARRRAKGLEPEEEVIAPRTESWELPVIGTFKRGWLQFIGLGAIGAVTLFFVVKGMMGDMKKERQPVKR